MAGTQTEEAGDGKLSTSKLAQRFGVTKKDLENKLIVRGYLEVRDGKPFITAAGKEAGGEFRSSKFGPYFIWPEGLEP